MISKWSVVNGKLSSFVLPICLDFFTNSFFCGVQCDAMA